MRKYINKVNPKKITATLVFAGSLLSTNVFWAQNKTHEQYDVLIPYNTAFDYNLDNNTSWRIKNSKGENFQSGTGNIKDISFTTTGDYVLSIQGDSNSDSCNIGQSTKELKLKVSPMKMDFDFSSIRFSREISGGQADGIILSVDAVFSSQEEDKQMYTNGFVTAGANTSIKGELQNGQVVLQQGVNTLNFILKGKASVGNYIMIDFVDINGEVQSFGLTEKIR
ncbi:hypothetical protein ACYSNX_05700 [Myroides sp. LJL115]